MKLLSTAFLAAATTLLVNLPAEAQPRTCSYMITQEWRGTCEETHHEGYVSRFYTSNGHIITTRNLYDVNYNCPVLDNVHYYPALVDGSYGCESGKGVGFYAAYKLDGSFFFVINH